ncbi:hypothetical protein GmHk_19G054089 [Glycine max]|nr:hypothetical protein GmHk_19G054089 [Glycine max]
MPDEKLKGYASFSFFMCFFFDFFFTACSLFLLKLHFFFLPPFEDDALVLLFSKCRMEMTEMPNEKLKVCSLFLLKLSFLSQKLRFLSPNSMNVLRFPSPCAFFRFFFIACSLFLLKLPFLSQKALICISKLHECASVSLSMCFFFIFFTTCSLFLLKLPFLSQKTSTFISKLHECASFSLSILNVLKLRTLVFFAFVSNLCQCNHFWFFSKATLTMSLYIPWNIYIRVT